MGRLSTDLHICYLLISGPDLPPVYKLQWNGMTLMMATFVRDSPETVIHEKPLPKGEAKYEYVILILTECRSVTATSRMSMLRDLILHGLTDMLCGQSKTDS